VVVVGSEEETDEFGGVPAKVQLATDERAATLLTPSSQSHFVSTFARPSLVQPTHRFAQVIVTKSNSRLLL
jgi:hypothetical protein